MKRITLFLSFLVMCAVCLGQPKHLTFKGIPICGTLMHFSEKLEKAGFERNNINDLMFHGYYAGFYDCIIIIKLIEKSDNVCGVTVQLPMKYSWQEISDQYKRLKKNLRKEYGEPKTSIEEFDNSNLKSNTEKFHEAQQGRLKYRCTFDIGIGIINLQIDKINYFNSCGVLLSYIDKASLEESGQEDNYFRTLGDILNRGIK